MNELREAAIVYQGLPVSSGGAHHLGRRRPADVWAALSSFLGEYAQASGQVERRVLVYEDSKGASAAVRSAKWAASRLFGRLQQTVAAVSTNSQVYQNFWRLREQDVEQALVWLSQQEPMPDIAMVPQCVVTVRVPFVLKDPGSGEVLPFQGPEYYGRQEYSWQVPLGTSGLYARLSSTSTCSLMLCLPFETVSAEARQFVARMQRGLPFTLSSKHWSRWQLNAARTRYYSRRVAVS